MKDESTGRAIAVTSVPVSALASASALLKMFLVKVFESLNLWMDLVDILPDVRYWSEVLCCIILTHISDLEVKVTDFYFMFKFFLLKFLKVYIFWSFSWILLILCLTLDTGLNFYTAPSPSPHYPWGQGHRLWNFTLKFLEVDVSWTVNWI